MLQYFIFFRYDSDNSSITYNYWSSYGPNWDTGPQPNNDDQSCVAIYRSNDHHIYDRYAWFDTYCSDKMEVVCEIVENSYSTKSTTTSTTTTTTTSTKGEVSP